MIRNTAMHPHRVFLRSQSLLHLRLTFEEPSIPFVNKITRLDLAKKDWTSITFDAAHVAEGKPHHVRALLSVI